VVVTAGGNAETGEGRVSADDWIAKAIDDAQSKYDRVEVVTADRNLRAIAQARSAKTINPSKYWRRYLPRLKGLKSDYSNVPKEEHST
jgi:hypothetical protein